MNKATPDQVREFRHECGHTQKQAADKIDVHWRTYQRYESGESDMPLGLLDLYKIRVRMLIDDYNYLVR